MNTQRNITKKPSIVPGELKESQVWNDDKMNKLRVFILAESKKQSPERKLKNELLSIKYQMQDFIENYKVEREIRKKMIIKISCRSQILI